MRLPVPLRIGGLFLLTIAISAHVGTNDVFFAGNAGPYPVRVSVRQPGVVPGLADINIRVEGDDVDRVLVTALRRIGNAGESPPPDVATPVRDVKGLYTAQLWLMVRGSHSVIVTVEGARGKGVADIPVLAAATRRLAMTRGLQGILVAGGLFLVFGLLTIVWAATRESVLDPGQAPAPRETRRARFAVAAATITIAVLLFGGWSWIRAEASLFNSRIDRPWSATARIVPTDAGRRLDFTITDSLWIMRDDPAWLARNNRYRRADLIADHGKLVHMFLVREPGLDAFAHVHPTTDDANTFSVTFPPLPAGTYRVYADLTHEDGLAHTLLASVVVPDAAVPAGPAAEAPFVDPDDAWWTADAADAGNASDEFSVQWINGNEPMLAGTDAELAFQVTGADGEPVILDPYMGMRGHAMLDRSDGNVFLHLHPVGMISMAAMQALERANGEPASTSSDDMAGMPAMDHGAMPEPGLIRFPLVAPPAGHYRIWVQFRKADRVITRSFETDIR